MLGPEGGHGLLDDASDVGWADAVPSRISALVGGHHPAVAEWLVVADADDAVPFVVAKGAHGLLADLHFEVGSAHVVAEVRKHGRKVLFGLPIGRVVLEHHGEGLAVVTGRLKVEGLVPGRIVWLPVHPAPLHPDDVDAPVLGHGIDENQCLLAFLASVLEEGVHICWELAAVGLQNFPERVPAGAVTTDANLRRPSDLVGVHGNLHCRRHLNRGSRIS